MSHVLAGRFFTISPTWEAQQFVSLIKFIFFLVMDITDIVHGKVDDEEKQHFIPFQQ